MRRLHIEGVSTRGCLAEGLAVSIAWAERGENCHNRQEGEGPYAAYTETSIFRPKKLSLTVTSVPTPTYRGPRKQSSVTPQHTCVYTMVFHVPCVLTANTFL